MGKQIEGKAHRKTAPNIPFASASSDDALFQVFEDKDGKALFSTYNPKEHDLPGPAFYKPKGHYKHLKSSEKVLNFGRSAPRGLDNLRRDHREKNKYQKRTAFDHGRLNPVIHRTRLGQKRGPGYYNPSPVRKKSPSASFGTSSVFDDVLPTVTMEKKVDYYSSTPRTSNKRLCHKTSFGRTSRFSKEIKEQHKKSLPELLEETRKELYYKDKLGQDFINHDGALGRQRLSRRTSAPKGLSFGVPEPKSVPTCKKSDSANCKL